MILKKAMPYLFAGLFSFAVGCFCYRLGFNNGWTGCFIDGKAIDMFHSRVHDLKTDADVLGLWDECKASAKQDEDNWNKLSLWEKFNYPISAFWKSGKGLPRYL